MLLVSTKDIPKRREPLRIGDVDEVLAFLLRNCSGDSDKARDLPLTKSSLPVGVAGEGSSQSISRVCKLVPDVILAATL
jgi:hypothetical protein